MHLEFVYAEFLLFALLAAAFYYHNLILCNL